MDVPALGGFELAPPDSHVRWPCTLPSSPSRLMDVLHLSLARLFAITEWASSLPKPHRLLIERGADVDAAGHNGWTPLHLAAANGARREPCPLCFPVCFNTPAPVRGQRSRSSPALSPGGAAAVRLLLEHGSDPTAAGDDDVTPLHCAAKDSLCYRLIEAAAAARAAGKSLSELGLDALMGVKGAEPPGSPAPSALQGGARTAGRQGPAPVSRV